MSKSAKKQQTKQQSLELTKQASNIKIESEKRMHSMEKIKGIEEQADAKAFYKSVNAQHKEFKPRSNACRGQNRLLITSKDTIPGRRVTYLGNILGTPRTTWWIL